MAKIKSVAVFCGSSIGTNVAFAGAARAAGTLFAREGITLVYGGGSVGLMGACADAALAAGGEVVGVIPRAMVEAERGHKGLSRLQVVETMHERKAMMADLSDGFLALPGGFGTLDELFEIVTWAQLGFHGKPVALVNTGWFYDGLDGFLDGVVRAGFVLPRFRALVMMAETPEVALERMRAHVPAAGAGCRGCSRGSTSPASPARSGSGSR